MARVAVTLYFLGFVLAVALVDEISPDATWRERAALGLVWPVMVVAGIAKSASKGFRP